MKLAISNIAWKTDGEQHRQIMDFLERKNVLLETTRIAAQPGAIAMQSLVLPDEALVDGLMTSAKLATDLGIKVLTLGAPKQKNQANLNNLVEDLRMFASVFPELFLAIEPVAPIYGGRVLSSISETESLVQYTQCYNIGLCMDSENFRLSGYDKLPSLPNSIKHVHIAPKLHKSEWDWAYINKFISQLVRTQTLATDVISIEMFNADFLSICRTIKRAKQELKEWLS